MAMTVAAKVSAIPSSLSWLPVLFQTCLGNCREAPYAQLPNGEAVRSVVTKPGIPFQLSCNGCRRSLDPFLPPASSHLCCLCCGLAHIRTVCIMWVLWKIHGCYPTHHPVNVHDILVSFLLFKGPSVFNSIPFQFPLTLHASFLEEPTELSQTPCPWVEASPLSCVVAAHIELAETDKAVWGKTEEGRRDNVLT